MHRLLVRLGALALSTTLAACVSGPISSSMSHAQSNNGATASTAPSSLEDEIRDAQLLRAKGDYTGAVRMLSQLMLVTQDDPRIIGEYGKVLVQQGRAPEALNFLKRAVELQPGDWTLYSALGVAYDQTKDSTKARDAYQRALVLKPGEAVVLNNFALSRLLAGDPAQAKTLMAEAAAAGSADPKIAHNVALIDGLAGPKAPPLAHATSQASATAAPATVAPANAKTLPAASHPPRPLVADKTERNPSTAANTVVMQQVPFDPLAGPVVKKPAKATPRKLAQAPRKLAQAPRKVAKMLRQTVPEAAKSTIPALRLANDRP